MGFPSNSCENRKQQALVLLLVRQLTEAQFERADRRRSNRLWQEVAALEIDAERVMALLFSGVDPRDPDALRAEDEAWLTRQPQPRRRGWSLQRLHLGGPRLPQPALTPG